MTLSCCYHILIDLPSVLIDSVKFFTETKIKPFEWYSSTANTVFKLLTALLEYFSIELSASIALKETDHKEKALLCGN